MQWNEGGAHHGGGGVKRKYGQTGVGATDPTAKTLSPELMGSIRKRRKVLPSSAMKRNSTFKVFTLDRNYRFFCSASNRWATSDEVAYDEASGSFQSVREYQRTVRPRNGDKQEVNFWPQLGIGETRYKTLTAPPAHSMHNPASAFTLASAEEVQQVTARHSTPAAPAAPLPPPPSVLDPSVELAAANVPTNLVNTLHSRMQQQVQAAQQQQKAQAMAAQQLMQAQRGDFYSETGSDSGMWESGTTVAGDADKSSLFDPTEAATSMFGGGDDATDRGSAIDVAEMKERDQEAKSRVDKVVQIAGVPQHKAQSALNEYDSLDKLPRKGTKEFSTWMTEFSAKHGFKPDILTKAFPRK